MPVSIPGVTVDTRRALRRRRHRVRTCGASRSSSRAPTLLSRCVQHETDHLDGILFLDRLDADARKQAMREIRESDWFADNPPEVRISPHSTFGRGM